MVLFSSQEEIY